MGALVIGAFLPIFIKNDYYMMVLNRVLINIIVVLGLNFITGLTGQMNLGTAGIFALGAYSSALFTRYTNLTPWLGLIAAVIMGILIGRGLGYPSLRVRGVYLSLTTIGFGEVVRLLISNTPKFTGSAIYGPTTSEATRYRARRKCITCFWYLPPLLFLLPGALPIPSGGGFSNPCGIMWRQWR